MGRKLNHWLGLKSVDTVRLYGAVQDVAHQYRVLKELGIPLPEQLEVHLKHLSETLETLPFGQLYQEGTGELTKGSWRDFWMSEPDTSNVLGDIVQISRCIQELEELGVPMPDVLHKGIRRMVRKFEGS
jgi:hypothetical protein